MCHESIINQMASLSNSWRQNREERQNRYKNKGDLVETDIRYVVCERVSL